MDPVHGNDGAPEPAPRTGLGGKYAGIAAGLASARTRVGDYNLPGKYAAARQRVDSYDLPGKYEAARGKVEGYELGKKYRKLAAGIAAAQKEQAKASRKPRRRRATKSSERRPPSRGPKIRVVNKR